MAVTQWADEAGPVEATGKWSLPVGAGVVTQLRFDYAFTLVVEAWLEFRIETVFSYGAAGGERSFDPSDSASLAPLLGLHQAVVTVAEIGKDGRLSLTFADGAVLAVEPNDKYEAFTAVGQLPAVPRGFRFVALPGGGLARM